MIKNILRCRHGLPAIQIFSKIRAIGLAPEQSGAREYIEVELTDELASGSSYKAASSPDVSIFDGGEDFGQLKK